MKRKLAAAASLVMSAVLSFAQPVMSLAVNAAETTSESAVEIDLPAELDLANYADQWVYYGDVETYSKGVATGEYVYAGCYALENIVYCSNPADPEVEVMVIFVPEEYVTAYATGEVNEDGAALYHVEINESGSITNSNGTTYTAETAPIMYQNMIDGYREGGVFEIGDGRKGASHLGYNADTVREGYVLVGCGARGTDSEVDGTAPAGIVDLKAGIRFLKANDAVLAGDSNKIIATGGSAGGGSVCVLGATGNSPLYDSYLEEIGAIMDATDDIYCVLAYCPITNLDYVDAAYEWLHASELTYTSYSGDVTDVDAELHYALIANYEAYLEALGFDLEEFEAGFVQAMNDSVTYYIENYVDDVDAFVEEYSDSLTYDEDGNVVIISKDAFIEANMARAKNAPASDSLDADSNESALFDDMHFSINTMTVLQELGYTEEAAEYAADLTTEQLDTVTLLSPLTFLAYDDILESDVAPFWHINNGTADQDFGSVAGYTIVSYLNMTGQAVAAEYNFVWGMGHGTAELALSDIIEYVDSIVFYAE